MLLVSASLRQAFPSLARSASCSIMWTPTQIHQRIGLSIALVEVHPQPTGVHLCFTILASLCVIGERVGGHPSLSTVTDVEPEALATRELRAIDPVARSVHGGVGTPAVTVVTVVVVTAV